MQMNRRQRHILVACGFAVVAMMLYPPLQFRDVGRGYGWIFGIEDNLAINAGQLLVQWVAVGIVGGIAFALASGSLPPASAHSRRNLLQIPGIAFRSSRSWLWLLLASIVASGLLAPAAVSRAGRMGAAFAGAVLLYALIFLWHCWSARKGEGQLSAERAVSWRWVSVAVLAGLIVLGAVISSGFVAPASTGRVAFTDEEVGLSAPQARDQAHRAADTMEPWPRNGASPHEARTAQPQPAERFEPDATPGK